MKDIREEDFIINPDALDVEWVNYPALFRKYSLIDSKAKEKLATVSEFLKTTRSHIINSFIETFPKATGAIIEANYRTNTEYIEAKERMGEATAEAEKTSAAILCLQQKKIALENLVKLLGINYFDRPNEPRNLSEEQEKFISKTNKMKEDANLNKARRKLKRKNI